MKVSFRIIALAFGVFSAAFAAASTPRLPPSAAELLSPSPEIVKDESNRIIAVTSATGETTRYEYFEDDDRALMKATTFPDGTRQEYTRTAALLAHTVLLPFTQGLPLPDHDLCASQNRVGFQGYFYSCSTRTYVTPAGRPYDPETGRFQTQDSYMGTVENPPSLHRYNYGYQNPTRYRDPSGHCPEGCDPLQGLPPDVIEQANQAQREAAANAFNQANHATQAGWDQATRAFGDARTEAEEKYGQAQAFIATETGKLVSAVRGDDPSAYRVGLEWVTGLGPRDRHFDESNTMTQELRQTPEIERARELVRQQIEQQRNGFVGPPSPVYAGRGLRDEPKAEFYAGFVEDISGRNATRAYVGSYAGVGRITNLTADEATVEYHAYNQSTGESALRLPPPIGYQQDRPSVQRLVGTVADAAAKAPFDFVANLSEGRGVRESYSAARTIYDESILPVNPRGDWMPKTILSNDPFGVHGPMSTIAQTFDWRETVRRDK
jgi:RHS repeat-associated protein